jgi:polar amino acid transport system substrate-binding protein
MTLEYSAAARRPMLATLLLAALASAALPAFAGAGALDRARETSHLRFGFVAGAKPFTDAAAGGKPEGYGIELCEQIAAHVKTQVGLATLQIDWVPVRLENRFAAVKNGEVDLLCTPASATLQWRRDVSFSLPVFPSGVRAVIRADAPLALREVLEAKPSQRNVWRASPARTLIEKTTFATVAETASESLLAKQVAKLKLNTATVSVPDYASGLRFLQERKIDVLLAEHESLLAAMDASARQKFVVLNRQFTHEQLALALARGDEDFRLQVDAALATAYSSIDFAVLYAKYFGEYDDSARTFFSWTMPPL